MIKGIRGALHFKQTTRELYVQFRKQGIKRKLSQGKRDNSIQRISYQERRP